MEKPLPFGLNGSIIIPLACLGVIGATYYFKVVVLAPSILIISGAAPNEFGQNQCFCRCLRYLEMYH